MRSNDKREGAGSNNWGSTKEHIQEEEAVVTDDKVSCLFYSYFAVSIILFFVVNICTMNGRSRSLWNNFSDYLVLAYVCATDKLHSFHAEINLMLIWSILYQKDDAVDEGIGASGEESANEAKADDEPQEMTLAEYKALQKAKRTNNPEINRRVAGEGENKEQWKNSYLLENEKKKVVEKKERKVKEKGSDEESEEEVAAVTQTTRTKTILDIDFQFSDSPMRGRGRGRGGRGMGGRGGRGRGGMGGNERGYQGQRTREQQAPKFDDAEAFPSLK